jgi:hypothetical protein
LVYGGHGKFSVVFLIAFLNSPCYETPKKRDKTNRAKQPREEKKTEEKKAIFFVMSPDGFFLKKKCRVFEPPLLRNAQKRDNKSIKNRLKKVSNYCFFGAAANVRHFHHFFFHAPPCIDRIQDKGPPQKNRGPPWWVGVSGAKKGPRPSLVCGVRAAVP